MNLSTVSRWLARVHAAVEHAVLSELRGVLLVESPDLESLVRSLLAEVDSATRSVVARSVQDPER